MNYQYANYEKKGHIAYVTLNRPEVMNALHDAAHVELHEIFNDFKKDDETWVAIITGAGNRAFSAGNDLKATAVATARGQGRATAPTAGEKLLPFGGITSGFECTKPLIAAVNGVAVGGGFELVMACDLVIAADHARFGLPEPRVGLIAGAGGMHRLPQQIPLKQAMGMLLTGRLISVQEAYRIGLVNEVVPAAELMATAERWANEILECSPLCVQLTKEAALAGLSFPIDEAMQRDWSLLERLLASEDFVEGPRAFTEKRRPLWTGRQPGEKEELAQNMPITLEEIVNDLFGRESPIFQQHVAYSVPGFLLILLEELLELALINRLMIQNEVTDSLGRDASG